MFLRKSKFKNTFIIAGLFLSALVGAGFGSGREVFVYFASLGPVGAFGWVSSCLLLGLASARVLALVCLGKFTRVDQVAGFVAKGKMKKLFTLTTLMFAFIGYVAMLSGIREVLEPVFPAVCRRFPLLFGILTGGIVAAFSMLMLTGNFSAFARVCAIVTPVIIFFVALVSIFAAFITPNAHTTHHFTIPKMATLILKSGLYTGYNVLFLLGVLGRAGDLSADEDAIRRGSLLGAGMFLACGLCIFVGLGILPPELAAQNLPLPAAIYAWSAALGRIFSCILSFAMLLCAACNLGAVGSLFGKKTLYGSVFAILGIPLSYIGFDSVISVVYPLFGFVGILFLLTLAQTRRKIV